MVELASLPDACVAQIARKNVVNDNVFLNGYASGRMEVRVSLRLKATIDASSSSTLLPVEVIPDSTPSDGVKSNPGQLSMLNAASCCVAFLHVKKCWKICHGSCWLCCSTS